MIPLETLQSLLAAVLAIAAGWSDLRFRKIPNALTLPAIGAGLLLAAFAGLHPFAWRVLATLLTLAAAMLLFQLRVIGGGDGKYLAAIAALCGGAFMIEVALWSALLGGVVALAVMLRKRTLVPFGRHLLSRIVPIDAPEPRLSFIPLAPVVSCAVFVAMVAIRNDLNLAGWLGSLNVH